MPGTDGSHVFGVQLFTDLHILAETYLSVQSCDHTESVHLFI